MKQLEQLQKCYQVTHTRQDEGNKTKTNKHQTCFYIKHLKAFKTKKETVNNNKKGTLQGLLQEVY